jgi:hypothetical protein
MVYYNNKDATVIKSSFSSYLHLLQRFRRIELSERTERRKK